MGRKVLNIWGGGGGGGGGGGMQRFIILLGPREWGKPNLLLAVN